MVPLSLFKSSSFSGANLLTLLLYAALGIFFFLFPLNLIQVQKYSPTATGAAALPLILLLFFLSRWSGGLVARYGPKAPLIVGPLIAAGGFLLFALPSVGAAVGRPSFPPSLFSVRHDRQRRATTVVEAPSIRRASAQLGYQQCGVPCCRVLAVAILRDCDDERLQLSVQRSLDSLDLAPRVLHQIQSSTSGSAVWKCRPTWMRTTSSVLRAAIDQAFDFVLRLIMLLCVGLAVASAVVASRIIPSRAAT
jgi:hypothetical protein